MGGLPLRTHRARRAWGGSPASVASEGPANGRMHSASGGVPGAQGKSEGNVFLTPVFSHFEISYFGSFFHPS